MQWINDHGGREAARLSVHVAILRWTIRHVGSLPLFPYHRRCAVVSRCFLTTATCRTKMYNQTWMAERGLKTSADFGKDNADFVL